MGKVSRFNFHLFGVVVVGQQLLSALHMAECQSKNVRTGCGFYMGKVSRFNFHHGVDVVGCYYPPCIWRSANPIITKNERRHHHHYRASKQSLNNHLLAAVERYIRAFAFAVLLPLPALHGETFFSEMRSLFHSLFHQRCCLRVGTPSRAAVAAAARLIGPCDFLGDFLCSLFVY